MPDYPSNPGGDDYYADAQTPEPKPEAESDQDSGPTALLPKSILMGKEFHPGDEVVLRIVQMHDDQIEVAYAPEKKDEHSDGGSDEYGADKDTAPSHDLSSMME